MWKENTGFFSELNLHFRVKPRSKFLSSLSRALLVISALAGGIYFTSELKSLKVSLARFCPNFYFSFATYYWTWSFLFYFYLLISRLKCLDFNRPFIGFVPFFRNKFPGLCQNLSRTQIDFSRALKYIDAENVKNVWKKWVFFSYPWQMPRS